MAPEELRVVWQLRRVLHALDTQQALELLIEKMKETKSNAEFLLQVQKTTVSDDALTTTPRTTPAGPPGGGVASGGPSDVATGGD